jgi:hypothetical protein
VPRRRTQDHAGQFDHRRRQLVHHQRQRHAALALSGHCHHRYRLPAGRGNARLPGHTGCAHGAADRHTCSSRGGHGSIDLVTNKQLEITADFGTQTSDAIAAKKIIAYTINAAGAWTRTPLATTITVGSTASSRVVSAPIELAGFYTIE